MKSNLKWKFIDYRPHLAAVMPVQTGIQFLELLDSGSRYPGLDPGLPGMTTLFAVSFGSGIFLIFWRDRQQSPCLPAPSQNEHRLILSH